MALVTFQSATRTRSTLDDRVVLEYLCDAPNGLPMVVGQQTAEPRPTDDRTSWVDCRTGVDGLIAGAPQGVAALDRYIEEAGIAEQGASPLVRWTRRRSWEPTECGLDRDPVPKMVKRRAWDAGVPEHLCNHSFRATGITNYLANSGTLETAAAIAGHASTRPTQLYNRNEEAASVTVTEIDRIRI